MPLVVLFGTLIVVVVSEPRAKSGMPTTGVPSPWKVVVNVVV